MALDTLIKTVYSENYEKNLENELVLDKLSATKYAAHLKMGDEMDVELPGQATLQNWDGGDLADVEEAGVSVAKIKVDKGMSANFEISQAKAVQIQKSRPKRRNWQKNIQIRPITNLQTPLTAKSANCMRRRVWY